MVVQHNIPAMNANRYFGINNSGLSKSLEKLSSGYAINRAGDNAAGLAVSEKMRSQIAGLTQGVKNAQDGISMIQTYEGALTETDSILQRMKTLADQSANGTYQDDVDRDAIQLEFDQLNDELNQIADTDFNGVVVLNGGQMADGLKQVDGKFDYSLKAGQLREAQAAKLANAQAEAQKVIDAAQTAFDTAKTAYDAVENRDLSNKGNAIQWNTVDDSYYNSDMADKLFTAVKDGADSLKDKGVSSFDVTFKYDKGANTWSVENAQYIDNDGVAQKGIKADVTTYFGQIAAQTRTGSTGLGGFTVGNATNGTYANAIFDATNLKDGDTVTLTFTNDAVASKAPTNIGFDDDSVTMDSTLKVSRPTISLNDDVVTDEDMTEELKAALDSLDKANVEFEYKTGKLEAKIDGEGLSITRDSVKSDVDNDVWNITYKNSSGNDVILASVTLESSKEASQAKAATISAAKGNVITGTTKQAYGGTAWDTTTTAIDTTKTVTLKYDGTAWKDSDGNDVATALTTVGGEWANITMTDTEVASLIDGTAKKGDQITLKLNLANGTTDTLGVDLSKGTSSTTLDTLDERVAYVSATYRATEATMGKLSFGVALSKSEFDSVSKGPDIEAGADLTKDSASIAAIDKKYYDTKAALSAAKAAYPKSINDLPGEDKVSVSDALDNGAIPLTYTDHVMLQAGARSKDLVDFTFKYSSGGMGNLKANMNCSARADGLGTENLSLKTAKDANYAIDQIDNAINKVSMVRATFGAVQNRLEHKIDNMNVTKENMTSAESRIRDTNMAEEMTNFTKNQILSQASQAMLAQANQLPQGVLQLLG